MKNLFAGIDSSTQSTKLVVINYDNQEVVFNGSVNYDTDLPKYNTKNGVVQGLGEGISESEPTMWIEALEILFKRLYRSNIPQENIKAISVSGQQHGLVSLDNEGSLTRKRSKLWNDFSTQEECDLLTEAVGGVENMIAEVGNSQRPGYTAAKIYHFVRNEPEAYKRTSTLFLVHNYINWYLTGGKNRGIRVMEPGDTSGMALWNPKTQQWSEKVINAIAPDLMSKLPEVKTSDKSIGFVSRDVVDKFGFNPECKVDAGSGDNMYGAVGTGNIEPGIVTISLGTSGTAYTFLQEAFIDPLGEIAAFCDSTGKHLPLVCVSNLANGYNEILDQYNITHSEFNELIKLTSPGNNGRLLIPWYEGERTPDVPQAAPTYFGFGLGDFQKEILARSVLEGHILNLYDGFKRLPVTVNEIRLTGGLSRSEAWRQTIADIFNAETVPVEGEGAALGAALHAAWVWNNEQGNSVKLNEITNSFVKLSEEGRTKPIENNLAVYKKQKELFTELSKKLRDTNNGNVFKLRSEIIEMK
ncbi:Xylulose kinase [hydrothermal vent metagenome]|uniref:Xylulose kinase n=1 Tax=hydrothermal vent metagenome TaxID=652676 RepID=A0A3B1C4M5_9ZZZZ